MKMPMQRLSLGGFRGATSLVDIAFDGRPVVMIFGENGTGKSTIVDAIDFVCNEHPGPLAERQSTPVREFLPALGCDVKNLKVEIEWSDQKWKGVLSGAKPKVTGPAAHPRAIILRKSEILAVVDAQPAKRYEAFSRFVAVPKVEQSENALREAVRDVQAEFNDTTQKLAEAQDMLTELWKAAGSPGGDYLIWAKNQAAADSKSLEASAAQLAEMLSTLRSASEAYAKVNAAKELDRKKQDLLDSSNSELKAAQEANAAAENELLRLLEGAEKYLDSHRTVTECPVCEQKIDVAQVLARLAMRRTAGNAVSEAARRVSAATRAKELSQSGLNTELATFRSAVAKLAQTFKGSMSSAVVNQKIPWNDFGLLFGAVPQDRINEANNQAETLLPLCGNARMELENERQLIDSKLRDLNAIKLQYERVLQRTAQVKEKGDLAKKLQVALTIVEGERKQYVEEALDSITTRVDELYSALHPGEGIGNIKFQLDPNRRGSLNVSSTFLSASDVPPQAYYSEAHLDTLGICIFVALAEGYADGETMLVLDDVLTSADQAHIDRFIDMIHGVCTKLPVLITTHYRPWRDRYRYAKGPTANVQLIELLPWRQARGVCHTKTKLVVDELKEALAKEPVDRQAVSSKAGVLLEACLDYLCALYQCKLPHKPGGNHTLGEYLSGIDSKLRKLLRTVVVVKGEDSGGETVTVVEIKPLLDNLDSNAWIRNIVGAHFNLEGMEVADAQVFQFGNHTCELMDALICPNCGDLPRKSTGSFYLCGCNVRQLHPLTIPGAQPAQIGS